MCNSFIRSKTVRALKPRRPMFRRRTRFPMKNLPMFRLHLPSLMFRRPGFCFPTACRRSIGRLTLPNLHRNHRPMTVTSMNLMTYPMSFSPRMNRCRTNLSFCPIRRSPPNLYAFRCNTPAGYLYHNNMSMTDSLTLPSYPYTHNILFL